MLELRNISFGYKERISIFQLDQLQLKKGEMVALLGPNGSGKSSLIKCISGIEPLKQGKVLVDQKPLNTYPRRELAKMISTVLTDTPFPYQMPVVEFVSFGRYPFNNWFAKQSIEDGDCIQLALQECELEHLQFKLMGELSDGERQRCMIARSLAQQTEMIVLDEPTTHLDSINTTRILKLLRKQAHEQNKGVLFSTHKLIESLQIADKLWLIYKGEVLEISKEEFGKEKELQKELFGRHYNYDALRQKFNVELY